MDFKLTEDQFILLQNFLPKKYMLIRDPSVPIKPNPNPINKSSNQISFTSNQSLFPEIQTNLSNHDTSKQISREQTPHDPQLNAKSQLSSQKKLNKLQIKTYKQNIDLKSKELLIMLLDTIETKKSAEIFLQPVDPVEQNIPHYFTLIKNPMDLKTMRTKINKKQYKSFDDFKKDIDQIVCNCVTFNAGNEYFIKIGAKFGQDCKSIFQKNKDKIQNLCDLIEKFNELKSKDPELESPENSKQQISIKLSVKKRKSRLNITEKTEESSHQTQELIENCTQQDTKNSRKSQPTLSQKKGQENVCELSLQKFKKSEYTKTIAPKEDKQEDPIVPQVQKIEEQKKKGTKIDEEKRLKLLNKIRVISKEKKNMFFQQISLVKGQQLDFKALSRDAFLQIENKFDEFMKKK